MTNNTRVVKKSKGGAQDLLLGKGKVLQDRAGGTYEIDRLDIPVTVNSIAEMEALDTEHYTRARVYADDVTFDDYIYSATDAKWHFTANRVTPVNSVADIAGFTGTKDDQQISLKGWHPDSDVGGGILYWDAAKPKSSHNGGTVFSPTVPFSPTTGDYLDGVGETAAGGSGCWVARDKGFLSILDFGAAGDGIIDDTGAVKKCFEYASATGATVVQNTGIFKMSSSSSDIVIKTSVDLKGSVIKPAGWTGSFVVTRDSPTIEHDSLSPAVIAINANPSARGSREIPTNILDNSFIRIYSNEDMYVYRGDTKKRIDVNLVFRNGRTSSGFMYDLTSSVTLIRQLRIADTFINIDGFSFDESDLVYAQWSAPTLIKVMDATKVNIKNTSFFGAASTVNFHLNRIRVLDSAIVSVDTVRCDSPVTTVGGQYTYTLRIDSSYDLHFKNITSAGSGWGSTAGNHCAKVVYDSCKLNRIDFHEPAQGSVIVRNCEIGGYGILLSIMGNLDIYNSVFYGLSIVHSREDMGGWCDGNLTITNCATFGVTRLLRCAQEGTPAGKIPDGSPVTNQFFKDVSIDGLSVSEVTGLSLVFVGAPTANMPPELSVNNLRCVSDEKVRIILGGYYAFKPRNPVSVAQNSRELNFSSSIKVKNSCFDSFDVSGNPSTVAKLDICFDGIYQQTPLVGEKEAGVQFDIKSPGRFVFNNSKIRGIDHSSVQTYWSERTISINGGIIDKGVTGDIFTSNSTDRITARGVTVYPRGSGQIAEIAKKIRGSFHVVDASFVSTYPIKSYLPVLSVESGTIDSDLDLVRGYTYGFTLGYTGNTQTVYFRYTGQNKEIIKTSGGDYVCVISPTSGSGVNVKMSVDYPVIIRDFIRLVDLG